MDTKKEKYVGVWLDTAKAFIISLVDDDVHIDRVDSQVESRIRFPGETSIYSRKGNQVANPANRVTHRRKHQLKHYFDEISDLLQEAEEIYIFGPSEAKIHLSKFLSKDPNFTHRIKKVDSEDMLTENQMIAHVKEVFATRPQKQRAKVRARVRVRR